MSKIKINKKDMYRVLLTDVLPYETTLIFSNEGYHELCLLKDNRQLDDVIEKLIFGLLNKIKNSYSIPYSYKIKRTGLKSRTLSIPHPLLQKEMCGLYKDFDNYMIYLCSKSQYSIRFPASVVSAFHKNEILAEDTENDALTTASNYFSYHRYRLLYQFYNSYQFIKLEKKYTYMRKFDISKCFSSIYTHSITWAITGKQKAKENRSYYSFGKLFDDMMQCFNYNETAGIIIGPEFSRIFAEIILQYIDVEVQQELQDSFKLCFHKDYEVYRYVDDYFVFSQKEENLNKIQSVFQKYFDDFRLYINDSKTENFETPFTSSTSMAKDELKIIFDEISNVIQVNGNEIKVEKNTLTYINLVSRYKNTIARNNSNIYSVNSYSFYRLKKIAKKFRSRILINNDFYNITKFLEIFIDFCFYTYSTDVRVTTTYSISVIIVDICNFIKRVLPDINKNDLLKLIFDEIRNIINNEIEKDTDFIELANLLIVLKCLDLPDILSQETVCNLYKKIKENYQSCDGPRKFNYLSYVSLLYFCSNRDEYKDVKKSLLLDIKEYLKGVDLKSTTDYLLFFDMLTCPYFDKKLKETMLEQQNINDVNLKSTVIDFFEHHTMFVDWSENIDISRKLKKREYVSPYE